MTFEINSDELGGLLPRFQALGLRGFNVTIPHKERMTRLLNQLSPEARQIGAVNCATLMDGLFHGTNTDWSAFTETLASHGAYETAGTRAMVLGAGGGARAVVYALAREGAREIVVLTRNPKRAADLVRDIGRSVGAETILPGRAFLPDIPVGQGTPQEEETREGTRLFAGRLAEERMEEISALLSESQLLVNATPVGMKGSGTEGALPLPDAGALHSSLLVYDLVYSPRRTALLAEAKRRGSSILDGRPMLAYQAAEAFRLWTGEEITGEEMLSLAEELLAGDKTE